MFKEILKEEAGIADSVNNLTEKIKSIIDNDYNQNGITNHTLKKEPYSDVYYNSFYLMFENVEINIVYAVLNNPSKNEEITYRRNYPSSAYHAHNKIVIYLTAKNKKIKWFGYISTLQHEIEHLYQAIKKNDRLLSCKKQEEYNRFQNLLDTDDLYLKIIGFTYYYSYKFELNAIINGMYREIINLVQLGEDVEPMEIIKSTNHYNNIQTIKKHINNSDSFNIIKLRLKKENINPDKFLSIANNMINAYIKAFGRLLYKVNKDIKALKEDRLINNDNLKIE